MGSVHSEFKSFEIKIKMKTLFLLCLISLSLLKVDAHELICKACGKSEDGTFTGKCASADDTVGEMTCTEGPEYGTSCMAAILYPSDSSDPVYFKKCYPTPFHAKGCLTVDEEDGTGTLCYCDQNDCNTSFDPKDYPGYNGSGNLFISSPIILVISTVLYHINS